MRIVHEKIDPKVLYDPSPYVGKAISWQAKEPLFDPRGVDIMGVETYVKTLLCVSYGESSLFKSL